MRIDTTSSTSSRTELLNTDPNGYLFKQDACLRAPADHDDTGTQVPTVDVTKEILELLVEQGAIFEATPGHFRIVS